MYYQQQADGKEDAARKSLRLSVRNRDGFPTTKALRMYLILSLSQLQLNILFITRIFSMHLAAVFTTINKILRKDYSALRSIAPFSYQTILKHEVIILFWTLL